MKRPAWSSAVGWWANPAVWLVVLILVAGLGIGMIVATHPTRSATNCADGYRIQHATCVKDGTAAPNESPGVPVPPGDQKLSFGYASIDVPAGWQTSVLACFGSNQTVFFGAFGSHSPGCSPPVPRPTVYAALDELAGEPASGKSVTINGHHGTVRQADGGEVFDFADLHVELTVSGPQSGPIAASIDWSPLYRLLHDTGRVVLHGPTRTYRFQGLQVTVPASWPAWKVGVGVGREPGCGHDFIRGPDVLLGVPFLVSCAFDREAPAPSDGVWLSGRNQYASQLSGTVIAVNHGTTVYSDVLDQDPTGTDTSEVSLEVRNRAGQLLTASVGLGPDPEIAEAIIQSIQATTGPDTHVPNLPS